VNINADSYRQGLTSTNQQVLERAANIVDRCSDRERERGESADRRVGIVLVVDGVLAGALSLLGQTLASTGTQGLNFLTVVLLGVAGGFIAKALFFSLRSIEVRKPRRLTHDLAEEMQHDEILEAIRTEIAWKRWEIEVSVPFNTRKLFWLSRSQRNTIAAMMTILVLSMVLMFQPLLPVWAVTPAGSVVEFVGVFLLIGLDQLRERKSFWYSSSV
jgi:hypothetical protein